MKRKKYKKRKLKIPQDVQEINKKARLESIPSEDECISILKEIYLEIGVVCSKCGGKQHYWKSDRNSFECKKCKYRTSLKINTIMKRSRLPIHYWVVVLNIMIVNSSNKRSVLIKEINEKLDNPRYESIFYLCDKIYTKINALQDPALFMTTLCFQCHNTNNRIRALLYGLIILGS